VSEAIKTWAGNRLRLLLYRLHEVFQSHHFAAIRRSGGYVARCSCGVYLGSKYSSTPPWRGVFKRTA
jgi:hypothetical protein